MRIFDPCNRVLKIRESFQDSNSQHRNSLGSVRVRALTLFAFSGACDVSPGFSSWPATFQPLALVVSPRLGLRHSLHRVFTYFFVDCLLLFFLWLCLFVFSFSLYITKKNWNMEAPQNKRLYGKICFPFWPTYMGEKGRTLGKTYGIKAMCYWEHPWSLGNILGTQWEFEGNMLGTKEKEKNPLPPKKT